MKLYVCPICNKEFKSNTALAGHSNIHGGFKVAKICKYCNKDYTTKRCKEKTSKYCSDKCRLSALTESSLCGRGRSTQFKRGNVPWNKGLKGIHLCPSNEFKLGHPKTYTSFKKGNIPWNKGMIGYLSGEKHYNWKGGCDSYYGDSWYIQRKRVRKRDGYTCQICGKKKDDNNNRNLDVHHIIPYRLFENSIDANKLSNLITLCPQCHKIVESMEN